MTNIETIKNIKVGNVLHPLDATYLDGHPIGDFQLKSDDTGGWSEAVTAEETARKSADATLQSNIDKKVSKDDETWLENFMPKIILNKNGTVQSVTVGDNVAANYATISARLSRYGGVVIGTTIYQDNTPKGRVVQVHSKQGQSFPNVLYVTAIYNYGEHFTEAFANSIYEIVLNYNSEGTFVSGTYEFKPISEVFEIELERSPSGDEYCINKTYDDFNHFRESLRGYKSTPLIILNGTFFLTRYNSYGYGSSNDYHWVYELSFISIKDKQLVGYYIVVEKDKTTVTPFEFQAQTQEEIAAATNKIAELEENVTQINANFQGMSEFLQPIIEGLQTGKQDTISDLATIRANAANGQTAFGWGDHADAGYVKPFIINITFNDSTQKYEAVDILSADDVQSALNAHNLILLNSDGAILPLTKAFGNAEEVYGITLQFFTIYGDGNEREEYIINIEEFDVTIDYYDYTYATYDQIQSEETERKAADQVLQSNINKKIEPFIINLSGDGSAENPYTVDKTREEVAVALAANSLILLKGEASDFPGYFEIYTLNWATNYPTQALMLQFGNIDEASLIYTTMVLVFSYQEGVGLNVMASSTKLATDEQVKAKQDKLISGTNIKTINGESILGSGDLVVGASTIQAGRVPNSEVSNGINPSNAGGYSSHAEGDNTQSMGFASHAEGSNTIAINQYSHAEGSYNVEDFDAIHSVGIGAGASARKDAHRITYDGKHYIIGIGGFDGTKATENLTNEKDLATIINNYESRIAALETALAGVQSQLKSI